MRPADHAGVDGPPLALVGGEETVEVLVDGAAGEGGADVVRERGGVLDRHRHALRHYRIDHVDRVAEQHGAAGRVARRVAAPELVEVDADGRSAAAREERRAMGDARQLVRG